MAQRKRPSRRASSGRRARVSRAGPLPISAAGRSPDARDWVAGLGWRSPSDGSFHIEIPFAVHHDQARALQRTADAVSRHRTLVSDLVHAWGRDVQLLTLPLGKADARRVVALLRCRVRSRAEPFRGDARIGLGLDRDLERKPVAIIFRQLSITRADGSFTAPLAPDVVGRLDHACRVDGRVPVSGETADLTRLEDEPVWAAGVGYRRQVPGVPVITSVLALGHTAPLAAARGMAVAVAMDALVPDVLRLKVVLIRRIDARLLRESMEEHLAAARRAGDLEHMRHARVSLGQLDGSIDTSFVFERGTDLPDTYDEERCAVLAAGAGAVPQLWEAGVPVDVDWESRFVPQSAAPAAG